MCADVSVGALLSGGLDSSLVVALMRQHSFAVKTFTVAFDQDPNEERTWARRVAKKFDTDHHELIISEHDAFSFFSQMVYYQDEPLGDVVCIPLYYVSKLARDAGIKVLQVGEGADELFCGYFFIYRLFSIVSRTGN
jgi:asparagine synthase (glutamine-hydrolysing)